MPKFGNKNTLFWYFWSGILRNYCHIQNQRPGICIIANFCAGIQMPKFGTKNSLLAILGPEF